MNDTIFNFRQQQILKLLKERGVLSRLNLTGEIVSKKGNSKITVIRDLNELVKKGYVTVQGKGRATSYSLVTKNSLLEYLDLDRYFKADQEKRNATINFNNGVYKNLSNLYSKGEIELWEEGKVKFGEAKKKLDPSIYKRELERFVIELSWKSSQIEGNTYSLIETETLIKQDIRAQGHPEDEARMILNHKDAFDSILKNKDDFKKLNFSDVIQLHNILTKGLVTSGIRSQKVMITGTNYEPLSDKHELENSLKNLITHINSITYPPERALILAAMIAYIQPFADGNKRTARMLSNAVLIAHDYLPLSYRNVDINEYRSAMIIFYETNNLFNFKHIFMDQLEFAIHNYFQQ
ncbi:MAG: Fic protein [Parcubacteria group bacterium GW2011_GWC1_34_10]|nr:MAG: Fic protein [Parcubacteria group bacterium GW2011_GWC1_34_10]